jgi:hypothetical protein
VALKHRRVIFCALSLCVLSHFALSHFALSHFALSRAYHRLNRVTPLDYNQQYSLDELSEDYQYNPYQGLKKENESDFLDLPQFD